jgi:hypothetical protein
VGGSGAGLPLAGNGAASLARGAVRLLCYLFAGAAAAQVPATAVSLCSATILESSGTTVTIGYAGLPGNQPRTYGNFVALWQSSAVSWTVAPAFRLTIPSNSEVGTVVLAGVSIGNIPDTIAYAVGPKVDDICASALLAADGSTGVVDAVSLRLVALDATSLTLRYHTLSGYLPATAGNWIGLWRGSASPYNAPRPLARVKIAEDVTDDRIVINGVTLEGGEIYTVVYFMDETYTSAAVLLTLTAPGLLN